MEDLKIFAYNKPYKVNDNNTLLEYSSNGITMPSAKYDEVIINKVAKYLLTEKGTDLFEPDYGSNWILLSKSVSIDNLPRLSIEINRDIANCINYLRATIPELSTILFTGFQKLKIDDINQIMVLVDIKIVKSDNTVLLLSIPVNR